MMRAPSGERATQGRRARCGRVIFDLVKANPAVAEDRGWPRLECDFDIVIITKGK
jgi:hypothetical protein